MPPPGFEPAISEGERSHTNALDRAAAGIGWSSKVQIPAKKRQVAQRINVGEYNVETVNECTYLGNRLTSKD
jgi:hypothetical protein